MREPARGMSDKGFSHVFCFHSFIHIYRQSRESGRHGKKEMKKINLDHPLCRIDIVDFCTKFKSLSNDYGFTETMTPFINQILDNLKENLFQEYIPDTFSFTEDYENKFFQSLLGTIESNVTLYKYASAKFIDYIKEDNISMMSIVCMNDTTECDYADDYLRGKGLDPIFQKSEVYTLSSHTFITSFTKKPDDLTMWRLYGDNCKGVSVGFKTDIISNGFNLAKVSYAERDKSHKELDFIKELSNIVVNNRTFYLRTFIIWKHFFKPYDYKDEEEYRLLYFPGYHINNRTWIYTNNGIFTPLASFSSGKLDTVKPQYPLYISEIWLGPKMPQKEVNQYMIELMLNDKNGWTSKDVQVVISNINNYR